MNMSIFCLLSYFQHVNEDPQIHQINKPNLDAVDPGHIQGGGNRVNALDEDAGAGDHDNRIENQGPVNLQVS